MDGVLVVGARTTGLMMAAELARRRIPVRIVDKSPGIDPHVRVAYVVSVKLFARRSGRSIKSPGELLPDGGPSIVWRSGGRRCSKPSSAGPAPLLGPPSPRAEDALE